jgi:lipopolysaccharide export system permease protein
MSWSWTLYRYLARQFVLRVGIVYAALLLLAFSIDLVNLIDRAAGHGVSSSVLIAMALLHLPVVGLKMLPFAVLFGGVYGFIRLSRGQELVATRAAGVSAWDFLLPPLAVAIVLGIVVVLGVTPLSSTMLNQFSKLEA